MPDSMISLPKVGKDQGSVAIDMHRIDRVETVRTGKTAVHLANYGSGKDEVIHTSLSFEDVLKARARKQKEMDEYYSRRDKAMAKAG